MRLLAGLEARNSDSSSPNPTFGRRPRGKGPLLRAESGPTFCRLKVTVLIWYFMHSAHAFIFESKNRTGLPHWWGNIKTLFNIMTSHSVAIAKASLAAGMIRPDPISISKPEIARFHTLFEAVLERCSSANIQV